METKLITKSLIALALGAFCTTANATPMTEIYPQPQVINSVNKEFSAERLDKRLLEKYPPIKAACAIAGINPNGKTKFKFDKGGTLRKKLEEKQQALVHGAYWISLNKDEIKISAADEDGKFYALQTIARMIEGDGEISIGEILDWPDTEFRGSIEGFYGKPWEHERRISQIQFYGKYKMNAYIYGPKDDPYSGFGSDHWRHPYPEKQAQQISELVAAARENHVNFIWALHPGATIRWHDKDNDGIPDDVIVALQKFEAMYKLGVRAFAVFFDDIGGEGAKAGKQAEMLNYLNREFIKKKPDVAPLLMCPTDYAGAHGSEYKKTLGAKLDKDINIMWTGPRICSDIPAGEVKAVSEHWQRKPFIWWNWPVDDYCRTNLLLGRTYGLDKSNKGKLAGFASNPMDKPEASKIALFSIADWAWNINAFDSQKSWTAAFPRLYKSGETADAMFLFAQHNSDQGKNGHGYRREESVSFQKTLEKARQNYASTGTLSQDNEDAVVQEFKRISSAAKVLSKNLPKEDPALWHEIEFWVKSFASLGKIGTCATELPALNNPEKKAKNFAIIANEKAKQQDYFAAQKQRHFEETFPSDKRWATGCKVSTRELTPFADKIFESEWNKFYKSLGGNSNLSKGAYKAFTNVPALGELRAERNGIYVNLTRINEVVKLAPQQHIGLELPEGVFATYIHLKLDNPKCGNTCIIEVSKDGNAWTKFNAKVNGGEIQNPVNVNEKIRFFRLVNKSNQTVEFRINQFKFDVPADSKANTKEAMSDGDPLSFFTLTGTESFTGPQGKRPIVLSDAPDSAIQISGNTVKIIGSAKKPIRIFEIIWR